MPHFDLPIAKNLRPKPTLTESENRFRLLVETLPFGILEYGSDGVMTFINPAYSTMHGYNEGELLGKHIWELQADESERDELRKYLAYLTSAQPHPTPYFCKNRTKDGGTIDVKVEWSYKRDTEGKVIGFVSLITEMTESNFVKEQADDQENTLRSILKALPDMMFHLSREGVHLSFSTPNVSELYSPAEEIVGKNVAELLPQEVAQIYLEQITKTLQNQSMQTFEYQLEFPGNEIRSFEARMAPCDAESVIVLVRNITDREQSELIIREREKKYRTLEESSPYCIHEVGLRGEFISMNRAGLQMIGETDECAIRGVPYLNAVSEKDHQRISNLLESALRGNRAEFEFLGSSGTEFQSIFVPILNSDGDVERLLGITQDITQRKQSQQSLIDSEKRSAAIINTFVVGIITVDERGIIESFNSAAEKMFGYTADEAIGENIKIFMASPYREEHDGYLQNYFKTGQSKIIGTEREVVAQRKDGTHFDIDLSVSEFIIVNKTKFTGVVRDISRRKQAEEEVKKKHAELLDRQNREVELAETRLNELKQQLINQTRLATIGQITTSIAHEVRNPLGSIRNAAYYLKKHMTFENPRVPEYLHMIEQEVDSADSVIRDMLEMAREKEPLKKPFDLSSLVLAVFQKLNQTSTIQCDLKSDRDPFLLFADRGQIRQVLENLIVNSIQAMNGKGEIQVELKRTEEQDSIVVRDNGPGIDTEHIDRLFEPLFSTKAKGTGLGLTICQQIVKRHGGRIEVLNMKSRGASFCVTLPGKDNAKE